MDDITLILYTSTNPVNLLSLNDSRSIYMLPIGGKFRAIDLVLQETIISKFRTTIIYNNRNDDLENYLDHYKKNTDIKGPSIKTVDREYSDILALYNQVMDANSSLFILLNYDCPAVLDFNEILKRYKKKKTKTLLYKLKLSGKSVIDNSLLVCNQKSLIDLLNKLIDKDIKTKNVFNAVTENFKKKGAKSEIINARCWPMKNIYNYYSANMDIFRKPEIFSLIHDKSDIRSFIGTSEHAFIGPEAHISQSFLSDSCRISGTVINSILFPGVRVGKDTVIKDSIILPYVKIGRGVKIVNTIIDETTRFDNENRYLNIGNNCKIGSEYKGIKSKDFPRILNKSITLIGKDCLIPDEAGIGAACYVASGKGEEYLLKNKYLYNGESIK